MQILKQTTLLPNVDNLALVLLLASIDGHLKHVSILELPLPLHTSALGLRITAHSAQMGVVISIPGPYTRNGEHGLLLT